jgi:hypothetical protein
MWTPNQVGLTIVILVCLWYLGVWCARRWGWRRRWDQHWKQHWNHNDTHPYGQYTQPGDDDQPEFTGPADDDE